MISLNPETRLETGSSIITTYFFGQLPPRSDMTCKQKCDRWHIPAKLPFLFSINNFVSFCYPCVLGYAATYGLLTSLTLGSNTSQKQCLLHCLFFRYVALNKMQGHFWHVSDTVFYALSHGSLHFVHGSFNNHLFQRFWLVVEKFWPIRKWLKKLPWTAKPRLPCERA